MSCHTKDSQKIKIKEKTKTPRITDEGCMEFPETASGEDERKEKKKDKTPVSSSKALFRSIVAPGEASFRSSGSSL